jgi:hypothetical protein
MKLFSDLDKKIRFEINEKNSEITDAFFVVEKMPKDKGVEVLYLLKPKTNFTFWVRESIINRRHEIKCIQLGRVATDKKHICLFSRPFVSSIKKFCFLYS